MKTRNRTNLNAYLFGNLFILCVLLISLWNKKPVWDVSLRFPNLLLILVIINSILIFKSLVFAKTVTKPGKKAGKSGKSLYPLRSIVLESEEINEQLYGKILAKLKVLADCDAVMILLPENSHYKLIDSRGEMPPAISGARFQMRDEKLLIKFPGNLGEEEVGKPSHKAGPINFKSAITRLEFTLFSLRLKSQSFGLLLFTSKEKHKAPALPFSSTTLYLETVAAMVAAVSASGDLRYKDKSTGLLKFDCFNDSFETEIERSERYQQELTLFSVKISFCEESSEEQRQSLQKAAAVALKQSLRRLDLMFCGQQDCEFIAILTETSAEVAEIVAQRVQKSFARQLEKAEINSKGKNILFIGSASYPTNATHGHGLLEMSREALAQAEKEEKEFVSYSLNE